MAISDLKKRLESDKYKDVLDALDTNSETVEEKDLLDDGTDVPQGFVAEDIKRQEQADLERNISPYMRSIESQADKLGIPSREESQETQGTQDLVENFEDDMPESETQEEKSPYQKLLSEFRQAKQSAKTTDAIARVMNRLSDSFSKFSAANVAGGLDPVKPTQISTNRLARTLEEYKPQLEDLTKRRKQDLLQDYREKKIAQDRLEAILKGTGKNAKDYELVTKDRDGIPWIYAVNKNDPGNDQVPVGRRGYSPKFRKDPMEGFYMQVRPEGTRRVGEDQTKGDKATPDRIEEQTKTFYESLDTPKKREALKQARESFNKESKDTRNSIESIEEVSDNMVKESIGNPITQSQLGATVARIFENGRLTDEDVKRYTTRSGVLNWVEDTLQKAATGTITQNKARQIKEALNTYNDIAKESLKNKANFYTGQLSQDYSVFKNNEDKVTDYFNADYMSDQKRKKLDKVGVRLPNGRTGRIDADKIDAFLEEYPDAKIME